MNPSRFLRTETDDIILNAKIFKGSRIFKTVLKRSAARETHDQMYSWLQIQGSGNSGKDRDTDHRDRCTIWMQVWSRVPTWFGTHLPSPPDGESKTFYGISLKVYFTWMCFVCMCVCELRPHAWCPAFRKGFRIAWNWSHERLWSCCVGGGNLTLVLCENKCLPPELSPQPAVFQIDVL